MDVDDALPLSALEHLLYCERQCALIHVEGIWLANRHTAEGDAVHARVIDGVTTTSRDVRVLRSVPLRSERLALYGVADVVEFHRRENGAWDAHPVEYKRGARRKWLHDEVQLAAQAMALEEMLNC